MQEETVINLGIVAHVDAGKTTTAEQMLYLCKNVRSLGSVDAGTAQTDFMPIERARGISVRASSTILTHKGIRINLIDTPGHVDFSGEVERALVVLDAAVLILPASEGMQAQAEILWDALSALHIPTLLFINKTDQAGCDISNSLYMIEKHLTKSYVVLNEIINPGTKECKSKPFSLSDSKFLETLTIKIADFSDSIAENFLYNKNIPLDELKLALCNCVKNREIFPVIFGAANLGIGIDALLDAIVNYLPKTTLKDTGDVSGIIYKVEHDKIMGKAAHVRLFSGMLKNRDSVYIKRINDHEKISQIRKCFGPKQMDTGILHGGDIAALYGMKQVQTGDIIGNPSLKKPYKMAVPLFSVGVLPENKEDIMELVQALGELSDEDPLLDFEWIKEEQELQIKIMGTIQLEVLSALLKERYNLNVTFSAPSVIYKETPCKKGIGFEAYTMPKPCWAVVKLEIKPLKRGSGLVYKSIVKDKDIFLRYQNHIETSVPQTLKQGLYGWEVTDLEITLVGGEHHIMHTHPLDFFVATPMAVMNGLVNCGTTLLEPMIDAKISAEENFLGKIISDIIAMRGEFESPSVHNGKCYIEAHLPVATSQNYPIRLSSLTSGKGFYSVKFSGYKECALELGATTKRRSISPLDRSKWILHARNAL